MDKLAQNINLFVSSKNYSNRGELLSTKPPVT